MNKNYKLMFGCLFSLSLSSFAQGAFDGINTQIGVGFASLGAKISLLDDELALHANAYKQNVYGLVSVGYSYQMKSPLNLAANVFYNFGSNNIPFITAIDNQDASASANINANLANLWGVSIEPGYYFSANSLTYAKLGWANGSAKINVVGNGDYGTSDTSLAYSSNFGTSNGFLYGFGYKHLITESIYLGFDAYQISFLEKQQGYDIAVAKITPGFTYGGISLGIKL